MATPDSIFYTKINITLGSNKFEYSVPARHHLPINANQTEVAVYLAGLGNEQGLYLWDQANRSWRLAMPNKAVNDAIYFGNSIDVYLGLDSPVPVSGGTLFRNGVQSADAEVGTDSSVYAVLGPNVGAGDVKSVNGVSPDANGNVTLTPGSIGAVSRSGDTMTGDLNMDGNKITGLPDPVSASDPITLGYLEALLLDGGVF